PPIWIALDPALVGPGVYTSRVAVPPARVNADRLPRKSMETGKGFALLSTVRLFDPPPSSMTSTRVLVALNVSGSKAPTRTVGSPGAAPTLDALIVSVPAVPATRIVSPPPRVSMANPPPTLTRFAVRLAPATVTPAIWAPAGV